MWRCSSPTKPWSSRPPSISSPVPTAAGSTAASHPALSGGEAGPGATEVVGADALFLMIGAEPHTSWLGDCVQRCDRGFVLTGRDLVRAGELPKGWPLERQPMLLETSIPGVFAVGDVRHRSVKRVASAVGEGATSIQLVHEYLSEAQPE